MDQGIRKNPLFSVVYLQVFNIEASGINLENHNAKFFKYIQAIEAVVNRVKKFIYENLQVSVMLAFFFDSLAEDREK